MRDLLERVLNLLADVANLVVELQFLSSLLARVLVHLRANRFGFFVQLSGALLKVLILGSKRLISSDNVADFVELFGLVLDRVQIPLEQCNRLEPLLDALVLLHQNLQLLFLEHFLLFEVFLQLSLISNLLSRLFLLTLVLL